MRLRSAVAPENPVVQAVAQAAQARDAVSTREALASLESMDAEALLPVAVELLQKETKRPQRLALWIGGVSVGIPLLVALILLAFGISSETIWSIVLGLVNMLGAGVFVAVLLWWQVTSRWLLARQAAVQIAARLVDPASLQSLINLVWLSQRRRDAQVFEILEAALVRLLSRLDPELHSLSEQGRKRLLALTEKGDADLQVATLLTLASLKEPLVIPLARRIQNKNTDAERVRVAARECLEALGQ